MLNTFGDWAEHIAESSLETTIDYVLTGATVDTTEPSVDILSNIQCSNKTCTILDFGSGIGRNCIYLALNNPRYTVYAYDNPKMSNKMKEFGFAKYKIDILNINNLKIINDWNYIKNHKFDYIYATLVFQHINENSLDIYIQDIKQMTNNLIVYGRRANDYSKNNTWQILEKHGLLPINIESYQTYGDPEDHQLAIYDLKGV